MHRLPVFHNGSLSSSKPGPLQMEPVLGAARLPLQGPGLLTRQVPSDPSCRAPEGQGRARIPEWQEGGSGEFPAGGAPRTFVNEAHILLMGRGEDLAAAGGRAGATVPLAVVDDSGDGGTGGAQHVRKGWGQSGAHPLTPGQGRSTTRDPPGHRGGVWSSRSAAGSPRPLEEKPRPQRWDRVAPPPSSCPPGSLKAGAQPQCGQSQARGGWGPAAGTCAQSSLGSGQIPAPGPPLPREPLPPQSGSLGRRRQQSPDAPFPESQDTCQGSVGLRERAAIIPVNPTSALTACGARGLSPLSLVPCLRGHASSVRSRAEPELPGPRGRGASELGPWTQNPTGKEGRGKGASLEAAAGPDRGTETLGCRLLSAIAPGGGYSQAHSKTSQLDRVPSLVDDTAQGEDAAYCPHGVGPRPGLGTGQA